MIDNRTYAWCNEVGLISFGPKDNLDAHAISHGTDKEMAIVRKLAIFDGTNYWVPGIRDASDWEERIETFSDRCCEHMDDGITLTPAGSEEAERYHEWIANAVKSGLRK